MHHNPFPQIENSILQRICRVEQSTCMTASLFLWMEGSMAYSSLLKRDKLLTQPWTFDKVVRLILNTIKVLIFIWTSGTRWSHHLCMEGSREPIL